MAESKPSPPSSPDAGSAELWRTSTTQVRDTIKYIVAGFAAVGAILVGTAPLTGLGSIKGCWWVLAIAGGGLALGGVLVAVWKASDVLLPRVSTLNQLAGAASDTELARLRDDVLGGDDGLFRLWGGTVDGFRSQRETEYDTLQSIDEQEPADEAARKALAAARTATVNRIHQLNTAATVALAGAQYAVTRDLAIERRRWIAGAAVAVALGVAMFTVAASRPENKKQDVKSLAASRAALSFTATGREDLADLIGSSCTDGAPALILSGGTDGPWEVVTTGGGGCKPARFLLKPKQGAPVYVQSKRVTITLTNKGKERLGPILGTECVAKPIDAVSLDHNDKRSEVVSINSDDCAAARFTVGNDEGTVK